MKLRKGFLALVIFILSATLVYGGATFSRSKTFTAGETLTATDLNGVETNILNNFTPAGMDDYSTDTTAMRVTTDPYPASSESLATSLQGEIERIRYVIKQITGKSQWYVDPERAIYSNNYTASGSDTYTVNITGYSAYTAGDVFTMKIASANTITAPTLNITSLGAKTIKRATDTALIVGDIGANHEAILVYNGTEMILQNPAYGKGATATPTANSTPISNSSGVLASGWGTLPVGGIIPYAGTAAQTGYLLCDGSAVSRTTYADLFNVIATTYGVGDGSTTFNVPNLKGKVPVGLNAAESEFDALAETGGAKTHTLTTGEIPAHTHQAADNMYTAGGGALLAPLRTASGGSADNYNTAANTGGGGAHNNLQPYITVNYLIKY